MTHPQKTSLTNSIARIWSTARRRGAFKFLCHLADRAASRTLDLCVSHVLCFDFDPMPLPASQAAPTQGDYTYRFLTAPEIRLFAQHPSLELDAAMADRIEAGRDVCFGVFSGNQLAGYGWCALGSIEPEHTGGIALSFPPHIGYMYKGFTHPDFRGRGLNASRITISGHALAELGVRRLVCLVDWTNWASLHSSRQSGCRELGLVVTFKLFGRRFWFLPDAARQAGIRSGADAEWRQLTDGKHWISHPAVVLHSSQS